MKSFVRRFLWISILSIPWAAQAHPQTQPATGPAPTFTAEEVGINEKLGQIIPLDISLKDEDGRAVTLRSLVDKPTVLSLNYFSCAGICTPQLQGIADVIDRTGAIPGKDFQVLTVSFDPRDTPDIARQKRADYEHGIKRAFPPSAWRFLTGDATETKRLTDGVGFKFKPQGMDFIHPATLIVLSPKGEITRYIYGVSYLPADLQMAVQEASRGEARPTINQWLNICFSYDPVARRYVLNLTRTLATVIIFGVVGFVMFLVLKTPRPKKQSKEIA